jgi:hypothetical protein
VPDAKEGTFELRVVDRATRAALSDVEVHHAPMWRPRGAQVEPLGDSTRLVRGASPLSLPAGPSSRHHVAPLVVASPGYALQRIEVDLAIGGELEVALERGGSLSIEVTELPSGGDCELRLHDVEGVRRELARVVGRRGPDPETRTPRPRSFAQRLASIERGPDPTLPLDLVYASDVLSRSPFQKRSLSGPTVVKIDQLAPGPWTATLVSDREGAGYCFGLALVRVEAGETIAVVLRRQPRPEPKFLRIHGVITVPREWESVPSEAPWIARLWRDEIDAAIGSDWTFASKAESELSATTDPREFGFDFGLHPQGLYRFELPRFGMAVPLRAAEEKERQVAVPPPVEVELTVLPPEGDRPVTNRDIRWATAASYLAMRDVAVSIEPDLSDGRYRFVAPQGPIVVDATPYDAHFGGDSALFDANPARRAISLRTTPDEVDLEITLRDGARALASPWLAKLRIERDGRPIEFTYSFPAHGTTVDPHLPGPGRYRIFVSGVEGYDDPPPVDVEVFARRRNIADIPMRRRT